MIYGYANQGHREDQEKINKLLAEAGYTLGIDMNLAVGEEWIKTVRLVEIIKQEAAPAGTTRTALWCALADQ